MAMRNMLAVDVPILTCFVNKNHIGSMLEAFFYDAGGGPAFAATGSAQNSAVTAEKTLWLYRDYTLVSGINRAQFQTDAGRFRAAYLHELRKQGDKTMWCSVNSMSQIGRAHV